MNDLQENLTKEQVKEYHKKILADVKNENIGELKNLLKNFTEKLEEKIIKRAEQYRLYYNTISKDINDIGKKYTENFDFTNEYYKNILTNFNLTDEQLLKIFELFYVISYELKLNLVPKYEAINLTIGYNKNKHTIKKTIYPNDIDKHDIWKNVKNFEDINNKLKNIINEYISTQIEKEKEEFIYTSFVEKNIEILKKVQPRYTEKFPKLNKKIAIPEFCESTNIKSFLKENDTFVFVKIHNNIAICYDKNYIIELLADRRNIYYNSEDINLIPYVKVFEDIYIKYSELYDILLSTDKIFYLTLKEKIISSISFYRLLHNLQPYFQNSINIFEIKV